jgi:predicted enzyme related to lactoylglutathione lyase
MSDYPRGRFCWHDLMTSDPAAAEGFYKEIVGWGTDIWEGGEMPYTMFTNAGTALGGVMLLPEEAKAQGAPPNWMAYVAVPSVGETVAKAKELGGTAYVEPTEIPNVGSFAVLGDPQGAVFAVFTSKEEAPDLDKPPAQGEFSWHELATTDHESAFDFYADLFGWQKTEAMDMGEAGIYQMYGCGAFPLGGMYKKPAEMPAPPHWLHYIKVEDVNAAVEKVKELGGQVLNGPMEVPGGDFIAQCMDPQGAAFALHSTARGS